MCGIDIDVFRQVTDCFVQSFGDRSAVGFDRNVQRAVQTVFFRQRSENHFRVFDKIVVDLIPFFGFSRGKPFGVIRMDVSKIFPLAKKQNVRNDFRPRVLFERRVRQSDRP